MTPTRQRLARAAYSLLIWLLQPVLLARVWQRGATEPLYREALRERLGRYATPPSAGWVWLHAVSLGETRAAQALVDALRRERPGMRLLLTHGTATGREAGRALLREGDRQTWLPYDAPATVQRFFAQFSPSIGVLMETEIWPNLLFEAQRRGVTMVLANARLSEKSQRKGRRLDALMRPAARSLSLVLAQTEPDAQRLREAGAVAVRVAGNLKFDAAPDEALLARGRAWRTALARPVIMAASTREGEEAALVDAWKRRFAGVESSVSRPLLLVVPRHPQRFDEIAAAMRNAGLGVARRSAWDTSPSATAFAADAWLGDSMREMALYFGMADVALLGGSFAPLGGQNLIEAAACGCPVVMGPHTFNFAEAAELAMAAGAAQRAADMDAGLAQAATLLDDEPKRRDAVACSLAFAALHRGAAQRMAGAIVELLGAPRA